MTPFLYGVISVILMAVVQISFSVYTHKHKTEWVERKIHVGNFGYTKTIIASSTLATVLGVTALIFKGMGTNELFLDVILIPVAVTLTVWISVMSALTDIFSLKVPMDLAVYGYWAAIPLAVTACFFTQDWVFTLISIGIFLVWSGFLYFFFNGGFGQADVRLLILYSLALTWWVAIDWIFYCFLIACIIQIIFHFAAPSLKIGKRRAKGQYYNPNIDTIPVNVEVYPNEPDFGPVPKKRSFVPLVPALATVYIIATTLAIVLDRTVCSAYEGIFCTIR